MVIDGRAVLIHNMLALVIDSYSHIGIYLAVCSKQSSIVNMKKQHKIVKQSTLACYISSVYFKAKSV
jgi:hypothetical protein